MSWVIVNLDAVKPDCLKEGCESPCTFLFAEVLEDEQVTTGMVCKEHREEFEQMLRRRDVVNEAVRTLQDA